jgi:hypothetical protein
MLNKVTNLYGSLCTEGDIQIGEKGLTFIPRIYNKLLIVFHTCQRNRKIDLYFPNSSLPPFSFDTDSYNDTLNSQIRKMEQRLFGVGKHFDEVIYERMIKYFNDFTNGEIKITPKTKVNDILICFMHNVDVIALWISNIPQFSIVSLLFNNNDRE